MRRERMDFLSHRSGPPSELILLVAIILVISNPSLTYITAPLDRVCTRDEDLSSEGDLQPDSRVFQQRSLLLEGSGHRSAALLLAKMSDPPCSLVIEVPRDTHAIAVSLNNFPEGIACPLSLWFHEGASKEETWSLDLCDREKRRLLALYPEVYPPRVTLRWNPVLPSIRPETNDTRYSRVLSSKEPVEIVATAVGRGRLCDEESRVLCWKMMKESLCVSEVLSCDGRQNCPRPGNDESETMCPQRENNGDFDRQKERPSKTWDILSDHLKRILAVKTGDREMASTTVNWSFWKNGSRAKSERKTDGGATGEEAEREGEGAGNEGVAFGGLSRMGPWTFVLLGMLACGSVLLMCGFWECCCRGRKASTALSQTPRGSFAAAGGSGQQTTVVIISSASPPPPQYEELEQPPDYKELFPDISKATVF